MKLAAIDIGSNAARFQVSTVIDYEGRIGFKKNEYIRFPLGLGHEVFRTGTIGQKKKDQLEKFIRACQILMDLHEVDYFMACATSAMREAENGKETAEYIEQRLGVKIQIISGNKEAELINKVVYDLLDEKSFLHIDVGGGSTELNFYVNREKVASASFKIGSVRELEGGDRLLYRNQMGNWIRTHVINRSDTPVAIGTGGNIAKIFDLAGKKKKDSNILSYKAVKKVAEQVAALSMEERIKVLMLNPDRADVIVPAANIYLSVMKQAGIKKIIAPDLGLKDGIIRLLFERYYESKLN